MLVLFSLWHQPFQVPAKKQISHMYDIVQV